MFGFTPFATVPFATTSFTEAIVVEVSGVSATGEVGAVFPLVQQWDLIPISQIPDWITISSTTDQLMASIGVLLTTESGDILCSAIFVDTTWTQVTSGNNPNWAVITYN